MSNKYKLYSNLLQKDSDKKKVQKQKQKIQQQKEEQQKSFRRTLIPLDQLKFR